MDKCPRCHNVLPESSRVCEKCDFSLAEDVANTLSMLNLDEAQATRILSNESMTPEKWQKVKDLFEEARNRPPEDRKTIVENARGEDRDVQIELENLLRFYKEDDDFLENTAMSEVVSVFDENKTPAINKITDGGQEKKYLAGTILGERYEIINLLGKGGMGEVYLAHDLKLDRKVAMKILPEDFANNTERMNRFVQEARAASALNHPNILTIYEIGEIEGMHFIAAEHIEGETLTDYLKRKNLRVRSILDIATQISSALVAAHEAGIIHRDIKPDNVMIRNDGIVKVLDFGIAKPTVQNSGGIDREAATRQKVMTKPGMIMGTPQYMSPEQARGRPVDSRSDIFSFGIVLYEMIAHIPPFSGENEFDTISAILKEEPKPLREYFTEVPDDLEHLVNKALRKDREQRYQSIKDLHIDLNDIKNTLETDLKLVNDTNPGKPAQTLRTNNSIVTERRFSVIHLLIFVISVIGLIGIVWWLAAPSGGINQSASNLKTEEIFNWASKPGEIYSKGTFSPDSKMVAFVSTRAGNKSIWVKRTTSGEAVEITKDDANYKDPVWSPNGEELAFYSNKGGKSGFWRIPILGGSPKLILTIDDPSSRLLFWAENDKIYYELKANIYAVNAVSGQTIQITNLTLEDIKGNSLTLSPDEKDLVYIKEEDDIWSFWISDLKNETPKKIYSSPNEIRDPVWHPDKKRLFFSNYVDGTFQIFETDVDGSPPRQLTFFEQDSFIRDVSSDGSKILYGWAKEESDVWKVSLADSKESNVISEIDSELWADVSPDGKTLVYQSVKNLSQGDKLYKGKVLAKTLETDENPVELADSGFLPKWSPNGRTIVYGHDAGEEFQLKTIKPDGSDVKVLIGGIDYISNSILPYNRAETSYYSWSPDSEKIVYISNRSGQSNVWIINADGSNNIQLTKNSDSDTTINCPLWSADSKQVAFTTLKRHSSRDLDFGVNIIDIETKTSKEVKTDGSFFRLIGWTEDGSGLLLAKYKHSTTLRTDISLLEIQIESGATKELAKLENTYQYNIYLSPDKKQIAYVVNLEDKDNIWVIPATGGEAKKVTENNDSRLFFSTLSWSPDNSSIFFGKQLRYSLLSMLTDYK